MGLNVPSDLESWQGWQRRQRGLRVLRDRLPGRGIRPDTLTSAVRGQNPEVLLALDSRSPSAIASLHGVLDRIADVAVVSSVHDRAQLRKLLLSSSLSVHDRTLGELAATIGVVISAGHYLPAGKAASTLANQRGLPNLVVQHGLMTPFAPPLPERAHVLAFTEGDGEFWASGRSDVNWTVTGSQLLWDAAGQTDRRRGDEGGTPYYLGQLHGAELPRAGMARATHRFWRETGATYRPHPSEQDRLSRVQHRLWERQGMTIDRSRRALSDLDGPVIAAFSTGILESAAAGLPAWAYYPNAPQWLEEFWQRYAIHRWGIDDTQTPKPLVLSIEPSAAIADAVERFTGGERS